MSFSKKKYSNSNYLLSFSFCFLSFFALLSQPKKTNFASEEDAEFLFKYQNYKDAISIYHQLLKKEPENYTYNYKIGFCYLNTYINKGEALKYFKFCFNHPKSKGDNSLIYLIARSYHLNYVLDSAIVFYKKYADLNEKNNFEKSKAELGMMQIESAKELIKSPLKISFQNLGSDVNTEFPDYIPWVSTDEKKLFFTSRRKGIHSKEIETDGYYSSDIFFSEDINGKWEKVKNLPGPGINSSLDEELVGIRPDGDELIIYKDLIDQFGDLYYSVKLSTNYTRPEKYGQNVNGGLEFSGSISSDDKYFFFVRKSEGKNGNQDIYVCKKLPNGGWGIPISAGEKINTKYDEDFPFLAANGKTLYFSSQGHNSMGGFDLFRSEWDETSNTFSEPVNLGYPLNTTDDEKNISLLPDERAGYISACRKDGLGDLDIYRIKFEDHEGPYTFINLKIQYSDSNVCSNYLTTVSLSKKGEKKLIGKYKTDQIKGNCILALSSGVYNITVESEGYEDLNETIEISDIGATQHEEKRKFTLQKIIER
ncbi:MAG: hypothetical protein ACK452_11775 [Bacteroidota bacterium]